MTQVKQHTLGKRLLLWILLVSSATTTTFTAISFWFDYTIEMEELDRSFSSIEKTSLKSIQESMFYMDEDLLKTLAEGIMKIPSVISVEILSSSGKEMFSSKKEHVEKFSFLENKIHKTYNLQDLDDSSQNIGRITVSASKDEIYQRLVSKALLFFLTQGLKTLIVSILILLIFHLLVTKHVDTISDYILDYQPSNENKLRLMRKPVEDELAILVETINQSNDDMKVFEKVKKENFALELENVKMVVIDRQKKDLQYILDNIDEGILLIDMHGCIKPIYSQFCRDLFTVELEKLMLTDLLEKIGLRGDELAKCSEVFNACLGETLLSWDANSLQLPNTGTIKGSPFIYHWTPIVEDELIKEVILSIRDASTTQALQKETEARQRLIAVIQAGSIGNNFLSDLLEKINEVIHSKNAYPIKQLLRIAHTAKGEARSLKFNKIVDYLHEIEQSLTVKDILQAEIIAQKVIVEIADLRESYDFIDGNKQQLRQKMLLYILQAIFTDADKRLSEHGFKLQSIIDCQWPKLTSYEINAIHKVLSHSISNSIDHGYILNPNARDKDEAIIIVRLWEEGEMIHLEIIDDGGGVNWTAVEKRAKEMGIQTDDREKLTKVMFEDSITTLDSISLTSGRGVGLAVVSEAARELNAELTFTEKKTGSGMSLSLTWQKDGSFSEMEDTSVATSALKRVAV